MRRDLESTLAADPEAVRIHMLGGFRIRVGSRGIEESEWRLRKAANLLKLLALAENHRLHRDRVMELLWPDLDPKAAANNLYHVLHAARRVLEPEAAAASSHLRLQDELLELCPEGVLWVDVEAFEEAAVMARRSREPAAYRAAIGLYTGDLLPNDRYEAWAEERREALRVTYLTLLVEAGHLHEQRGDLEAAIEAFQGAVAVERTHEEAHAGLMRLYARTGQRYRAFRQYEQLEQSLQQVLGAQPDVQTRRTYEEITAGRTPTAEPSPVGPPAAEPPDAGSRHNLPASLTSFVGREREVFEVERLLDTGRLLTLTGTGGSGKTRLALEVAKGLVGAHPDGVWLVELAPLSEPELVPQAVAEALGIRRQPDRPLIDALVDALRKKNALLVLDNCEHLVDPVARLAETLLTSCQGLRILATSRETLGAAGETTWLVLPLAGPEDPRHQHTVEELAGYESVRLFAERARYRNSAFALTPENARAVAEICHRLEGLPLAIELAAARVGLSAEQIAARLDDSLRLLTAGRRTAVPRQQTLRGTLDWSHELLSEPERVLFGRLSAFAGGWTLEAAEVVGAEDDPEQGDVLDLLLRLVDKSLVVAEASGDGRVRYRMLEPVRQYARERLEESGEADAVRHRHAGWCLELAEEAELRLRSRDQEEWLERLQKEDDNLRAALSWTLESEEEEAADVGPRLAGALGEFWSLLGRLNEGRRWLEAALTEGEKASGAVRAKALVWAGQLAWEQWDFERAEALSEEALTLSRELNDEDTKAAALHNLGVVAMYRYENERAEALFDEAIALERELKDAVGLSRSLHGLGFAAMHKGEFERAARLHRESLALGREMGDRHILAVALSAGGLIALAQGDYERAEALGVEGVKQGQRLGLRHFIPPYLALFAAVAARRGEPARSARLWGAGESWREATGTKMSAAEHATLEPHLNVARAQLGEEAWQKAWAEGRAMSEQEAVEYALSSEPPLLGTHPEEPPTGKPNNKLTHREREVAILAARGFDNQQIAEELSISERTASTHVSHILRKLELRSRAQITASMVEQQPPPEDQGGRRSSTP